MKSFKQVTQSTKSIGRPPEHKLFSTAKNMEDVRNEREFSPPEIHWREALKRMNREIRKVQSLPPVENLLETTPIIIKSSLEIREKYFNKKNEDLIRKARGIFDNPIPKNTYDLKNIISLCYADIMFLNDDDELVIYECKYLKPWDFPFEFVSATIMEECIGFHKINIIDLIRTFFCQDRLISIKQKINVDPSKPKRKYNNYSKTKINGTSAETSDWRSELKNRGKFVKTKILEEIDLGVPEYKPPFRSSAIVMDWRDVMKSQMENAEENDPFLKWNKLDPSPNKSKTRIKLKSPNQKTRIAAESNKFSENSNDSIFGAKIKLRPSNKDRPLAKQSVKKKTTKIINFVAISVTTEEEKVIDEIDHSPMTPKVDNVALQSENIELKSLILETFSDSTNTPIKDNLNNNISNSDIVNTSKDIERKDKLSDDKLIYSQHSETNNDRLHETNKPSTLNTKPLEDSISRTFKFSEEKRNFLVDSYFLGNLYIGPQKSKLNDSLNPLRNIHINNII